MNYIDRVSMTEKQSLKFPFSYQIDIKTLVHTCLISSLGFWPTAYNTNSWLWKYGNIILVIYLYRTFQNIHNFSQCTAYWE